MRDGIVLRADLWLPLGPGPFPTLVYRTPYGRLQVFTTYGIFRRRGRAGYAMVAQDVRGRYASDGDYLAYQQEGQDGYDTIEWAASQPWSNGAIGTFGLSYPGAVQWLAAVERPPHLKAMVPAMTFASPSHFWYAGGVWDNVLAQLGLAQHRPRPPPTEPAWRGRRPERGAGGLATRGPPRSRWCFRSPPCRPSGAWRTGTTSG